MIIEITLKENEKETNIAVNDKQCIQDCMRILKENHVILRRYDNVAEIYSTRKQEYIHPEQSFSQAAVYNGDILYLYNDKGEHNDSTRD